MPVPASGLPPRDSRPSQDKSSSRLFIRDVRRRSAEHPAPIRQRDSSRIGHLLSAVLGKEAFHSHLITLLQRILAPALLEQHRNRTQLEIPVRHFTARVLHVDVKVSVRIHPLHL